MVKVKQFKNLLSKPKIVIITGPTSSGKTGLGIDLAKEFNGEVLSADSRQLYKGMDIGTAKVKNQKSKIKNFDCGCDFFVENVPHHLIDIASPDEIFTVADFKTRAEKCTEGIVERKKTPFVVGGTGLYIKALIDGLDFAGVVPDEVLRKELESQTLGKLVEMLQNHDPEQAKIIDVKNPRRVLRAVEIALSRNKKSELDKFSEKQEKKYDFLQLGIKIPQAELYRRIDERINNQVKQGLVEEVKNLSKKYSFDLSSMSGIGYRQIGYYLRGEMSLEEALNRLKLDTHHYAKRQMTWFKRDKSIQWLEGADLKTAEALIERFLKET